MVLGAEQVEILAALPPALPPQMAPVAEIVAAQQAAALDAISTAVARHRWLPTLRHVDVRTGSYPVGAEAQVGVGDIQAVAAWAEAYGQPLEVFRPADPDEALRVHLSTMLMLTPGPVGPAVALRVWTVVRPPTGDPAVDRLLLGPDPVEGLVDGAAAGGGPGPAMPLDAYTEAWAP
jgi:hypothetical protein